MKRLIRRGSCNRCGFCCGGCHNLEPPNICLIYDSRPKDRGCLFYPPHPFERNPKCGFHFYDSETGEEIIGWKNSALLEIYESVKEAC
jgi:hypothetical protein